MFTGQLIGYVGADARSNKSGKGFYFPVSSKFKGVGDTDQSPYFQKRPGKCSKNHSKFLQKSDTKG